MSAPCVHLEPGQRPGRRGGRAAAMLGLLIGAGAAAGWATWPQSERQPHVPPTTRTPGCVEGGCHAETMSHDFLHGPTAVAACTMCHDYSNPAAHDFELKSQGRELCDFCHIDMAGTEGPVVHDPVAQGDCLSCHNPHGASDRKLLRRESAAALCADCHADAATGAHVHEPVAQGDCLSCHSPHTAQHAALLTLPRRELCLSCHEAVGADLIASAHVHDPAQGDCMDCHAAHASETPAQLLAPAGELCASCHEATVASAHAAPRSHSPVFEGRACLNCHLPHASRSPGLQFDDPIAACLECHKPREEATPVAKEKPNPAAPVFRDAQPRAIAADHPAPAAPDLGVGLAHGHGPVGEGNCAACHDLHGGQRARLLTQPLAEGFYAPFSEQAYALCFSCHDKRLVMETPTTATRFRDGDVNLHTLHVSGEQGRTCRACHNTHASDSPAQIRKTAEFGQWQLPLNFALTESGGSCEPGCHKPASYERGRADGAGLQAP